ncbi:histone H2A.Z-specific chaperone CHZ1 [Aspergillus nomiae NRRL 13137]|uniref:Histone H2A.Z-specific chaperone CHZ1 n=1 Tax=Aspergillus nomiae NRRL (strain ATCC 15546 / NRRL 13137 / CBS 260.88 / M93) TaxID=1509407 RepID=A0A0L1IT18_ASPN3|nr:histone H2A.Z-specific chaperone CHZ1 [Aspergillus nomiae NRRL 13137]KNG82520.1 histone H2A.Z-specific chaperone CHZ1 [Aspergillus nomiae NRRL 13137]
MDNNQANTLGNAAAATAPDTAVLDKGKHKATQDSTSMDVSMDEGESDESENEDISASPALTLKHILTLSSHAEEDDDDEDKLEPISADNIIRGERRTRGKIIDFQKAAEKFKVDEGDDDEDDEDFTLEDNDNNMRD